MSIADPEGDGPTITNETNWYEDLVVLRTAEALETDPTQSADANYSFGSPGGNEDLATLLDLETNQYPELVGYQYLGSHAAASRDQDISVTEPTFLRWDHSWWIRPDQPNAFIFDDPADSIETHGTLFDDQDAETGHQTEVHSVTSIESNAFVEKVLLGEFLSFNDTTNGSGGGVSGLKEPGQRPVSLRKFAGRGPIYRPTADLGTSGFIRVENGTNTELRMHTGMMWYFDVLELEEEPPTFEDILRGSSH